MEKKPTSHVVVGLILGAASVIYTLVLNLIGYGQNQALGLVTYLIVIGGLIYFIQQYGKDNDYRLKFGQLFSYGFKATAIITIISVVFLLLFFLLFPDFKEKALETARTELEKDPKITDEQLDQSMAMVTKGFTLFAVMGAIFGNLILGAIGSLIGAAVTKKNPPSTAMDQLDRL